ncbi:response regulators consisting of a CheY-like receiver domain and a winged-helix DNA-binding domain [Blautia sp. CAG:257]|nr:response regulators consisting of a CheY-like receiver domain and a winged-helix DNA-binding domain [Blautia sp. CAG:257]
MKILVVEDDLALSAGLCFELDAGGYLTVAAYTVRKAVQLLENEEFALVLLDVNLPDGNGFELCREIKNKKPQLPVIFLTANDLEEDVLNGFDLGAEDYVTKPFNMNILLDFKTLTAVRGKERLPVTPNEYKLLKVLTENAGNILPRKNLLEQLWDAGGNFIDDHTLTVTMNRLRGKIEDEAHTYIKTVRGMGYIWTGGAQ